MDREIKQLKRSRIPIIKVRWNSKRGPEFTWECEDEIHAKYPHLFSIITSSSIKSRDEISELGHEHKFITKIVARRANGSIVSITESDYKTLNKNDIEDMYLLIVCGKVVDYAETGLLWSLSVFIRSIKKYKTFSIIFEPVYGIIYKNNKKEKRVMRHQEIPKFCDATLKRVLEGLKSYNNDVKHGYVTSSLSKEDVEYLQLFEEGIEEWLKHRNQMIRWEIALNDMPFPLLEHIEACVDQSFSYLEALLVMGVRESVQDEAETSTNPASGETSSAVDGVVTVESDEVPAGTASHDNTAAAVASAPDVSTFDPATLIVPTTSLFE
ncbi:hypothetical protein Tco_0302618 [Tanacetum coccineum]